jgi:hypothetical protein
MKPFYLFLDFDGVLHPNHGTILGSFVHADPLGRLLARHSEVRVVVSSAWRETNGIDTLRACCRPVLGARIIGTTPVHRRSRYFVDAKPRVRLRLDGHAAIARLRFSSASEPFYERFEEIALWLAIHASGSLGGVSAAAAALSRDDWMALDDYDSGFPPGCPQLIHVDGSKGLAEENFEQIEQRLLEYRGRMSLNLEAVLCNRAVDA